MPGESYYPRNDGRITEEKIWEATTAVEEAWSCRDQLLPGGNPELERHLGVLEQALDQGLARVAEKIDGEWQTNEALKKAILLMFRTTELERMGEQYLDLVPLKFTSWTDKQFEEAGIRTVPGSIVRRSAYLARRVVVMPSFVNVGAYVDEGTMVDTWASIGSCAQIGKNCHISGGAGIGGVLEPLQSNPTIIEDDCFIGARSEVVEGVIVGEGSVLSMGVFIGASTRIINRETGEEYKGKVPPYSVVVSGSLPGKVLRDGSPGPNPYCAVIVKQVDERTRSKTSPNELLRAFAS